MTPLARVAIVGGISTGFVLPSIGRFAKAVTSTPTLPSAALGAIPGSVILLTHQLSSKVFNSQSWIAKKEITVYLIYVLDLAAGLTTTIIIATLTRTELQHAIAISTLSCCAILITLGIESFFKAEDVIKKNAKKITLIEAEIGQLTLPKPPPDSPGRQEVNDLKKEFTTFIQQFKAANQDAKDRGEKVDQALADFYEKLRRLKNKGQITEEALENLRSQFKTTINTVSAISVDLSDTKEKLKEVKANAQLARIEAGNAATLARRTDSDESDEKQPPKTDVASDLQRPTAPSFLAPLTNVWGLMRGKQPNASTTVNVDGESLKKGQV